MGGAKPKAVVEDDGSLWIAKFERKTDTFDQCGSEHATMRLAARCGIDVAETRLVEVGPRRAVLVKRFDRSSGPRFTPTVHFLSSLSLLNGDETSAEGSYFAIAAEILRHGSRPDEDLELFRRMVFNVLCGNRDDHLTMARCSRQIGTPSQIQVGRPCTLGGSASSSAEIVPGPIEPLGFWLRPSQWMKTSEVTNDCRYSASSFPYVSYNSD